jgi:hypothetical protein
VLGGLCIEILFEDTDYTSAPEAGVSSPLRVVAKVSFPAAGVDFPQPIFVDVNATGTVESSASGGTDGNGVFTASFTPLGGQPVFLTVEACVDDPQLPQVSLLVCQTAIIGRGLEVTPAGAQVAAGGTQSYTALLVGQPTTAVTWSASGGSIDANGVYTAGNVPGTYAVQATSTANTSLTASATVTVLAPQPGCDELADPQHAPRIFAGVIVRDNRAIGEQQDGQEAAAGVVDAEVVVGPNRSAATARLGYVAASIDVTSEQAGSIAEPYSLDGVAFPFWSDNILVIPTNPAITAGRIRYQVQGEASGRADGGRGATASFISVRLPGAGTDSSNDDISISRTEEFVSEIFGFRFPRGLRVDATGLGSAHVVGGTAQLEFSARWLGITGVEDRDGNPIGYTLCSASGGLAVPGERGVSPRCGRVGRPRSEVACRSAPS